MQRKNISTFDSKRKKKTLTTCITQNYFFYASFILDVLKIVIFFVLKINE